MRLVALIVFCGLLLKKIDGIGSFGGLKNETRGFNKTGVVEWKKDIPTFKGTYTRKRIEKLSTTTITPESILTEKDIVNDVCNECKRLDPTFLQCDGICPDIESRTVIAGSLLPLGDPLCYFCENYRINKNDYKICRDRFCSQ